MNIETGEIKDLSELTEAERKSGKWVPLPAGYVPRAYKPKTPATKRDFTRLQRADEKRARKRSKLSTLTR